MNRVIMVVAVAVAIMASVAVFRNPGRAGHGTSEAAKSGQRGSLDAAHGDEHTDRFNVPVGPQQPQKGPANAPVTIVVFSDFECPFCGAVVSTLRQIESAYGDRVRLVWRNRPLRGHANARIAAAAAMEAFAQGGNDKFWAMHDLLFSRQSALSRADLEAYAHEIGLDEAKFRAGLDSNVHADTIAEDSRTATIVGALSTPYFFVNGRPLAGAKPFEAFQAIIDDELARVEMLRAQNVPAEKVYETLTARGTKMKDESRPPSMKEQDVYQIPVSDKDPQRGPADALVTLVEFADFECKFSRRAMETLSSLQQKYGNDLRIVWKNNPLSYHDDARPAAAFAMEALAQGGNDAFWAAYELLFQNSTELGRGELEEYGVQLGLDARRLKAALDKDIHKAKIEEDAALAKRLFAGHTAPLFTINGRRVKGAQPQVFFEVLIDEELAKAKAKVAAGMPKANIYAAIIQDGRTEPAPLNEQTLPIDDKVYNVALPKDAPSRGGKKAPVIVQEFSDFQCPFCARVVPTLRELERQYGDQIRIVWRNYPLPSHPDAELAAQAAWEVFVQGGDQKFWAYHDLLFDHQRALQRSDLEHYAKQLGGIDLKRFSSVLDRATHRVRVSADADAYVRAGVPPGTPGFFINSKFVNGARPIEHFKAIIDHELKAR